MPDFIERYRLSDPSLCDQAISWFKENQDLQRDGFIGTGEEQFLVNKQVKDSRDISMTFDFCFNASDCFKGLLDFVWLSVNEYIQKYDELYYSPFKITDLINLQFYRPPSGGFKQFHCERLGFHSANRCLVWMIYLNTVEDGGGTEFKYYNHIEKAEKGKLLLWPPDFTHTHRGLPSETEEKYILTGWYEFF